ncbi:ABC-type nitrate/sulfonate/bicarbonate transport system substrate-binding protein [Sinorhizobium terangae]|uniref:PhnD/SsuA/transferrin family substrate-binding protein n=1 Tax=Sinorhizobium terangae TaxID=110322 RepID=A0A6N7LHZ0_SINTE|nr:ABC transporter substrate-binding protein [Sinorhizobium terangae]MBB4184819.1 ABC-type nitrate/sulfonate/bicarbonate transport system substrate-binding protein [Sinorhizobium terangae]MQX17483.1 PhnD/SsuA/transferrin family substrate-binding protein [Sinorhizobium terangae]
MKVMLCMAAAMTALTFAMPTLAQDGEPIDLSLTDVSLNKIAFLVAGDNGLYEKYGLNIHQFITKGAADRISRSGVTVPAEFIGTKEQGDKAPISIGGGSPLIYSMTAHPERGVDRVIVATTDSEARFHIIANSALNSAGDLKGKRLGFSSLGAVSHLMTLEFLRKQGWTPDQDITLVEEGMDYSRLKSGEVDAFIGSEIYYTMAEQNGAKDLVNLQDYNFPIAGSGVNVDRAWLAEHREETMNFLKAMIEAYALMKKDRGVVEAALGKWYGVSDPEQVDDMYAQVGTTPQKPYPGIDGIRLVKELYHNPVLDSHDAAHFYDESFVAELDKSGFIDKVYAAPKAN